MMVGVFTQWFPGVNQNMLDNFGVDKNLHKHHPEKRTEANRDFAIVAALMYLMNINCLNPQSASTARVHCKSTHLH